VNVELFIPAFDAFTFHWYIGFIPPLMGVAVNVTGNPLQEGLFEAVIVMLTGNTGLTDTGYWMLDAGLFVVQVSEDVNVQLIRSPVTGM
jgi:hypothetical protein